MQKIIIPLPKFDFDPTETGVPWSILTQAGIRIVFATSDGAQANCDSIMLTGKGLGVFSQLLSANQTGRAAYQAMQASFEFQNPIRWSDIKIEDYSGLLLPGGHAKGMRDYLESPLLQHIVATFFQKKKPVAAICHGVLLAARSHFPDGKSVLYGKKTTGLLLTQELTAWYLTRLWMKDYYRTYHQPLASEVLANLANPSDFIKGPMPLFRDNPQKMHHGFTVRDEHYLSARWPGDAHCFAHQFLNLLNEYEAGAAIN